MEYPTGSEKERSNQLKEIKIIKLRFTYQELSEAV